MVTSVLIWSAVFFVLLAFKLWNDKRLHDDKDRFVNHPLSALLDVIGYTIVSIILFGWDFWKWVLLACTLRWIFFDLFFNLLNGWKWNFCGDTSKIDVTLDNLDGIDDNICKLGVLLKLALLAVSILVLWM